MKKVSDFFYIHSNWFSCFVATGSMVAYAALVMGGKSACFQDQLPEGYKVLGLKTGYTLAYVQELFGSMNREGLLCYRNLILIWDNIFPVLYGLMYIFWLSLILKYLPTKAHRFRLLNLYPVIPVILDWTENFFELRLVEHFTNSHVVTQELVAVASGISQIKWLGSSLNYLIIVVSLILFFIHWLKYRKRKK